MRRPEFMEVLRGLWPYRWTLMGGIEAPQHRSAAQTSVNMPNTCDMCSKFAVFPVVSRLFSCSESINF